jgi:DNA-binding NarL/FixJ family response regulator
VKILIVDDSKAFRDRLRRHLADAPRFDVAGEASSGKDALVAIEAVQPDVILLDLEMPAGNGLTVLRRMRDQGIAIPVIIMTNHASYRLRERCVALGAHAVMDKLDVSSRLLPVLAELTDGRDR